MTEHWTYLTFEQLRKAIMAGMCDFKSATGKYAHSEPDGSDWSIADWMCAVTGELGELANLFKKVRRNDFTIDDIRHEVSNELADVMIYLCILSVQCDVDLAEAVQSKFNAISRKQGLPHELHKGHYVSAKDN